MNRRSIGAVLAGALVAIVITTLIDISLHLADVFPPIAQPIDDRLALLASSYRSFVGIGSAWLTARSPCSGDNDERAGGIGTVFRQSVSGRMGRSRWFFAECSW